VEKLRSFIFAVIASAAAAYVPAARGDSPPAGYHPVFATSLSPDQKRLAVARGDTVWVFDVQSAERPVSAKLSTPGEMVFSLSWSPDGKWLASGGAGKVRVWDVAGGKASIELNGLAGRVGALAFTKDSSVLLAGDEGSVRQWRVSDGTALPQWTAHGDSVLAIELIGDGAVLATAGGDKLVKLWERESGKLVATLEGHAAQVTALAVSPDGKHLASGGADREVRVWDLSTKEKGESLPPHPAGVSDLAWLNGEKVLTACEDGSVRVAVVGKERRFERTLPAASDALHALALSADGKTAYAGGHDGEVYAWSVEKSAAEKKLAFAAEPPGAPSPPGSLSFVNDVLPVLSKAGCNAGACHAKPMGQSGFRLSVFAYDPRSDHRAIVKEIRGRRVTPNAPEESLLLRKPTMAVDHGGGRRLKKASDAYATLVRWVREGMPYGPTGTPTLVGVEVSPKEQRYTKGAAQPLRVTAKYSDASTRDVTALSDFSSNEKSVATVDETGVVKVADVPGEAVIVARYMGMVDVSRVTVPADDLLPDAFYAALPVNNFIDRQVHERLKVLGLSPSDGCTDAEFLRRASLDATGKLPSPEQARAFLADDSPRKREKLIDQLLSDPAWADHWAGKWADLLRPNPFRAGVKSVYLLDQWLRDSFRQNKPYDRFVREVITARGSTHRDGPVVVFRDKREPADIGAFVAQVFLGVRMECARCHHHPNEKWSQEDFYQLAAFFAPLKRKGQGISAPISGEAEFVWFAPGGGVSHPVTGETMKPKAPDGPADAIDAARDPREALASWMTRPDNPFFARAAVNRVWAELMGRGIVHPVDDFRASNPPTNGPLLDALAKDFADHGYDLKHLVRTIMRSRAYQRSSLPNERNVADSRNFSRWYRRRPAAEVLLDAVSDVTGVRERLPGGTPDGRAVQMWNYRQESDFLDAFSRPNASADPPCERDGAGSVVQALHLMNSNRLVSKIADSTGQAAALAASKKTEKEIVEELYLLAYSRPPTEEELSIAATAFSQPGATRQSATEDVMWALINSAEFVFNH